jgi:transposase
VTRDEMEARRLAAEPDLRTFGRTGKPKLAEKYGVSSTTISRWRKSLSDGQGLGKRKTPGRPPLLPPAELEALRGMYRAGPRRAGWAAGRWTGKLFAAAIERRFGVTYSKDHALRLMWQCGKPRKRRVRS